MFWFDRKNKDVLFIDNRTFRGRLCDGRRFEIKPDRLMDFRKMKFKTATFHLVVFDPPHLVRIGKRSWLVKKYGKLDSQRWPEDIRAGFSECFRVLKKNGILIFKWNEYDIPVKKILELTPIKPLFGHRYGKRAKTHWLVFIK